MVLLDVKLPDINGFEVCRRLKAHPVTAVIPVLHLSAAHRDPRDHARGLDAGADGFLVEPVAPEILLATVRSVARARQAEEALRAAARQRQLDVRRHLRRRVRPRSRGPDPAPQRGVRPAGRRAARSWPAPTAPRWPAVALGLPAERAAQPAASPRHGRCGEFAIGGRWLQLSARRSGTRRARRGGLVILTDITERKRVETRARELLRARAARAAARRRRPTAPRTSSWPSLSHELRTPLNAILGWVAHAAAGNGSTAERDARTASRSIERNARLQAQLIEDLLDVSRIITGKLRLDAAPVDLSAVHRGGARGRAAGGRGQGRRASSCDVEPPAAQRARRRRPAAAGGLEPALQRREVHAARAARVDVAPGARRTAGSGSASRDTRHRHRRPSSCPTSSSASARRTASTTRTHGGLGLGLAIVRHLVELHGGRVEAASAGPARARRSRCGCRPSRPRRSDGVDGRAERRRCQEGRRSLRGVRVLVVDDDADARELLGMILRRAAPRSVEVGSAAAALRRLPRAPPDVLVSDIGMPGEDGYDLIRAVRRCPAAGVPAIALSAFAREWIAWTRSAPATTHLAKPVEPGSLRSAVAELLDARLADWAAAWYGSWRSPDLPGGRRRTAASLRSREDDSDLAGVTHQPQHRRTGRRSQSGAIHGGAVRSSQVRT